VPFPKFGIKLRENQSADAFMIEIEKRVNLMIGEYTMNEYKAYKALVKHKKRINRVFTEVYGDKSFSSRSPSPKLKVPTVAVASCSAAPINAPEEDPRNEVHQLSTKALPLVLSPLGQDP
jgi:hypothetical protein